MEAVRLTGYGHAWRSPRCLLSRLAERIRLVWLKLLPVVVSRASSRGPFVTAHAASRLGELRMEPRRRVT